MSNKKFKLDTESLMPLRDVVYHTLRNAILKGELEPGERLMEIHLANRLGVSRTPIREAIRMLEREGLAITYPRKGAQVARMTVKDLEDVIDIRQMLDVLAARNACERINEDEIAQLEDALVVFEKAIANGDTRHIVEADEAFHKVIYTAADNPKLEEIVMNLREQMYRYRYEYVKDESVLKHLLKEHTEMIEGLKKRDKNYVEKIMMTHVRNQYETVKSMIRNQDRKKA